MNRPGAVPDAQVPARRRQWPTLVLAIALLIGAGTGFGAEPAGPGGPGNTRYVGQSLVSAIAALESDGLVVYYSSDLIRPWMTVKSEPASNAPADVLAEILAPYALTLNEGPYGSLIVTRDENGSDQHSAGAILGIVRDARTGRRISGAAVTVLGANARTTTSSSGHFSLLNFEPGEYVIRVSEAGLAEVATQTVEVEPGRTAVTTVEVDNPVVRQLESMIVNASRYDLLRGRENSTYELTQSEIESLPDIGDDPLRSVARLPGTATNGFSGKSHVRGGETDETLVLFDGLRLYNPWHLKDFQSLFSAIDPAIMQGMNIYTGGFPARHGDRMSSVIEISTIDPPATSFHEVSQSLYNSSLMTAGSTDNGRIDWLASARRGNLDLVLDVLEPDIGEPKYYDLHGRFGVQVNDALRVTFSGLYFDDDISVSDTEDEEFANANYRDKYLWVRFDQALGPTLSGRTMLAHTNLTSDRRGLVDKDGISTGRVKDERDATIDSLQTDWSWWATDRMRLDFGGEYRRMEGDYDYRDQADFDLIFLTPGASDETQRQREFHLNPDGDQFGVYASSRYRLTEDLTTDVGLRWDKNTLSENNDDFFSPRIALLYDFGDRTQLRASWGRFYQSQSINELQIEDGITDFLPAQRADHLVLGLTHLFDRDIEFRLEGYRKDFDRLRARYENLLNFRVLLPELYADRIRIDADSALGYGIEASVSQRGAGPLDWWLNYSWSSIEDDTPEGDIPRSWDQQHALGAGLLWDFTPWVFSVASTWRSGWPTTNVELIQIEPIGIAQAGPRNDAKLGNYFTIDVRVARNIPVSRGTLTAFFELTNVLNEDNQCCIEYELEGVEEDPDEEPEEPGLDLEPLEYLPILPSIGFTWRF